MGLNRMPGPSASRCNCGRCLPVQRDGARLGSLSWGRGARRRCDYRLLSNLVSLCGHHHRLVHEGGWRLAGHPDRHLTFLRPNGQPFRAGPEPLQPRVRERLVEPLLPRGPDPPG